MWLTCDRFCKLCNYDVDIPIFYIQSAIFSIFVNPFCAPDGFLAWFRGWGNPGRNPRPKRIFSLPKRTTILRYAFFPIKKIGESDHGPKKNINL